MADFKTDLRSLRSVQIIRKYILNGPAHILSDDQTYNLKEEICEYFDVDFNNVILVGSAKLGFSIKPTRRYGLFGDESDIDIAVVSTVLFQKVWQEAFTYKKGGADWTKAGIFFKYISEGWMRPDLLPYKPHFNFTSTWWNFFESLTADQRYGPYKIRAGLYHSMFFLQEYQKICVEQCIAEEQS